MNILETRNLYHDFKGLKILFGVNLEVKEGERHAIIGPNGAGKTTLFNVITGTYAPSQGSVLFRGRDITGMQPDMLSRMGIGRSFQITSTFQRLTPFENVRAAVLSKRGIRLNFYRRTDKMEEITRETEEILKKVNLYRERDIPASFLSYGRNRALEVCMAMATDPDLVMLDEPTAGMSRDETHDTVELIRQLTAGKSMVIIEHDMDVVFALADRITVLHRGQILASGPPDEVRKNAAVKEAYLGEEERDRPPGHDQEENASRRGAGREQRRPPEDTSKRMPSPQEDRKGCLLEVNNLHTFFGASHVIQGVSLSVHAGKIVALLGRNGMGKSTTLKSIMGVVRPKSGIIQFKGKSIFGFPPHRASRAGIGYVPEERAIFPTLSVTDNLLLGVKNGKIRQSKDPHTWTVDRIFKYFPVLLTRARQPGRFLSGGEQQMLTIGRSLMGNPELLLVDEPTEGLAPLMVTKVRDVLAEIGRAGVAILLVEHNLQIALFLSCHIYLMGKAHIAFSGTPEELIARPDIREKYLEV